MEREKARLLEEAEAARARAEAIDREMAEVDRAAAILAKYGFVVSAPPADGKAQGAAFDGTVAGLIECYKTHPLSGFSKLGFSTRANYLSVFARLRSDLGHERVETLDDVRIEAAYSEWTVGRTTNISMGHSLIGHLRILASFGATVLRDQTCRVLRTTLHHMKFPKGEKQTEPMNSTYVNKIIAAANLDGSPNIALAQAFQADHKLGQRETIGQWVPVGEPGTSDVMLDGMKWVRGLRWNEIDENLELRRVAGKRESLKLGPLVRDQLKYMFCKAGEPLTRARLPASGPIIVNEPKGWLPYQTHTFRREWRRIATAAGVPKNVKNRDSRLSAEDEPDSDNEKESVGLK
jgi:hypothetical protein